MVWGPLGYWGGLNIGGIIFQLIGFILMLPQFQNWLKKVGKKFGDSKEEINETKEYVNKRGIYFVIIGIVIQLIAYMLNAYWPTFLSDQT